ncbi:TPA: hypothetical protein DDW69_03865 [candidate division CPR2 bacterium]|uniref:Uncharacterized protein n=1 Tax=candidate division CPR2 bacterium GW2011_GWC1_41_48 TaxID=1618344 RepID=A0A0G0Z7F9_UNCC2|nr:MAG: hypothetical protein UT47_C0003G0039 [candidate division CPR2 bacterium GW2011_GWC2_39_35]KKR28455.1 MAG: hypothetical protein UT59_C0027G0010 [candidate division CPR2 bacterium GW2011_GWD1_39_7]KKR28613.1 MAG: hypothetical protein UT60_C0016G0013 [candidate division CPR2 bacterium GW2011_GWD2_39_7]KKS08978.1 MAG: hypothetical protein UU65_C0003G0033 [candidate division CPR2 bacterium GW2011_GWC1_41_48]OGB60952.1 MAG: hypothetical protein A2Y27_03535 [candidate division CPR2 bacterium G
MEFYNVKKRQKVDVSDNHLKKTIYEGKGGQKRFAVRSVDDDGTKLTKFISKDTYDSLQVPTE